MNEATAFQAKFNLGQLWVTEHGAGLPAPFSADQPLMFYLRQLAHEGWHLAGASFEGYILTARMARAAAENQRSPRYRLQMLADSYATDDPSPIASLARFVNEQKELDAEIALTLRDKGWIEMATSKPLQDISTALYIVSLWMK
jgi:hypothetical protein